MSDTMHILSEDEILAAEDIKEDFVEVPEWGGSVKIRGLDLRQIANVASKSIRRNPQTGQDETNRELSVLYTLQEGMIEPKLSPAGLRAMAKKSAAAVTKVVAAINALGPTQQAVDEADKSTWPEPNAPIPIPIGAGVGHDMETSANGNVSQ